MPRRIRLATATLLAVLILAHGARAETVSTETIKPYTLQQHSADMQKRLQKWDDDEVKEKKEDRGSWIVPVLWLVFGIGATYATVHYTTHH